MLKKEELKKLIDCFEYLKKHYLDIFDALHAMLEVLLICKHASFLFDLRPKDLHSALDDFFNQYEISQPKLSLNSIKLNRLKKNLLNIKFDLKLIEEFIYIITQQKTVNKLYYYSTPLQVNRLLVGLLDIKCGEEVYNPCYGMGSVFLSLTQICSEVRLFGEELDSKLSEIAVLIAKVCGIESKNLFVNDLLKDPYFIKRQEVRKFDKILCNPPMSAYVGLESLKKDARFSQMGALAKHYSELIFLTHSLAHLKKRGVFIVRNQVLQKSASEAKMRQKLLENRMIEAIIELPKNIFPLQNHDLSIIVLAPNSEEVLHINANNDFFYIRDGKYNQLTNLDYLLELFKNKVNSPYSKLTSIKEIKQDDLSVNAYLNFASDNSFYTLKKVGFEAIRGQRVYGSKADEKISYYDIGIADFKLLGFITIQNLENIKEWGNKRKIQKYALQSYDILLSLRGNSPKITILGDIGDKICVANTGVVVLRHQEKQKALQLYCFLFTQEGQEKLRQVYEKSSKDSLSLELLLDLSLPKDYEKFFEKIFHRILKLSDKLDNLNKEIAHLRSIK